MNKTCERLHSGTAPRISKHKSGTRRGAQRVRKICLECQRARTAARRLISAQPAQIAMETPVFRLNWQPPQLDL